MDPRAFERELQAFDPDLYLAREPWRIYTNRITGEFHRHDRHYIKRKRETVFGRRDVREGNGPLLGQGGSDRNPAMEDIAQLKRSAYHNRYGIRGGDGDMDKAEQIARKMDAEDAKARSDYEKAQEERSQSSIPDKAHGIEDYMKRPHSVEIKSGP